jgi:predicted transcriptional regulator
MPPQNTVKVRESARRVIAAMREVRLANKEITTRNIAEQLGQTPQAVGVNLQKMVKEGLIRRHGMVLQFEGGNRAKNMLWRINTLKVRGLETNE